MQAFAVWFNKCTKIDMQLCHWCHFRPWNFGGKTKCRIIFVFNYSSEISFCSFLVAFSLFRSMNTRPAGRTLSELLARGWLDLILSRICYHLITCNFIWVHYGFIFWLKQWGFWNYLSTKSSQDSVTSVYGWGQGICVNLCRGF